MMRTTMKYIDTPQYGEADVMTIAEGLVPECKADEVLIKVHAAGVNRPDIIQREGNYPPPPGASPVLGLEAAGEIVAVGESVAHWQIGDQVCALCNGGAYAQFVAVPAKQCLPIPSGLSLQQAASLPETCFTVWSNLFDRAHLKPGESLLIHGGSSGIGVTAIQMAKALGIKVFITAGSAEKCQACLDLGADHAINYREQDFAEVVKNLTDEHGVDVILDMIGGDYIQKNIKSAAPGGRIVNIAFLQSPKAQVNFMPVMLKRLTLTGSTLRSQSNEFKASIAHSLHLHIWPEISAGTIKPVIYQTFPITEVIKAHQLMESSQHIGKIILDVTAFH